MMRVLITHSGFVHTELTAPADTAPSMFTVRSLEAGPACTAATSNGRALRWVSTRPRGARRGVAVQRTQELAVADLEALIGDKVDGPRGQVPDQRWGQPPVPPAYAFVQVNLVQRLCAAGQVERTFGPGQR